LYTIRLNNINSPITAKTPSNVGKTIAMIFDFIFFIFKQSNH
jgi:hypothetical protein